MKKIIVLIPVAALALVSCVKTQDVYTGVPESREIAFQSVASPATRAAVDGTTFTPTTMQVAAWDATNHRDFFTATTFTKDATTWKGSKYWPLSVVCINFLAYAELNDETGSSATWNLAGTDKAASGVTLVMADNHSDQNDLMYACGTGSVGQSGNSLSFPSSVPMHFKHAQAWVRFMADAADTSTGGKVTLNSITLNGAKYNGTFTVTHSNYDATSSQAVAGAWTALGDAQNVAVPGWTPAAIAYDNTGDGVNVGSGLLVVPDDNNTTADWTSFTINYSVGGKSYSYTYTPETAGAANVDQAKKYTFKISFHLHEIEIAADVTDWTEGGPTAVAIG